MPPNQPREHEAKFQVGPDTHPALFLQPFESEEYTLCPIKEITHRDTYLDTRAYQLLRHGIVLRVRQQNATYEASFKSIKAERKGAIQSRAEITISLLPDTPPLDCTLWPAALLDQLRQYAVKARQLRPMLVLRQQRQKAKLYPAANDTPLAEWSLDEVWLDPTDRTTSAAQAGKALFHELEIELLAPEGSNGAGSYRQVSFENLVRQVSERYALTPVYSSKLARGLEAEIARIHGNNHVLTPTMTLAQAGRLLLHRHLFQIVIHEHELRADIGQRDVHDMRVAIRRGRAALQLCHEGFTAKSLLPIIKGLKRLDRALGHVRDLDVALANLRAFRRGQPTELHEGFQLLRAELKSQRVAARSDLIALLDSKKHRNFIAGALRFCTMESAAADERENAAKDNQDSYEVVPVQVRHTLPSRILAAFEAVRAYETAFSNGDLPPLETFHALRKQAKHLRYVVEFAQHLLGEEGATLAKELRVHQEFLGELNDAHVEQLRLQCWAATSRPDSPLHRAIETRLRNTAAAIDRLTTGAPDALARLFDYQSRATLTKALARL